MCTCTFVCAYRYMRTSWSKRIQKNMNSNMCKRRLTVQREQQEEGNRTHRSPWSQITHSVLQKYFYHINSLNPDHMLYKQSPLGGGKVEIWSGIWGSGPCSQDGLSFKQWGEKNQRSRVGQVLKSMQRSERICNSRRRGDVSAWKKIKQRTWESQNDIICV